MLIDQLEEALMTDKEVKVTARRDNHQTEPPIGYMVDNN